MTGKRRRGQRAASGPDRNFPIEDDTIGGNVIVYGTSGAQTGEGPFEGIPDSTEIATNTIGGNLACHDNSPPAQLEDAVLEGGGPNTVHGNKMGECAGL
ncbi:MAG TPA: hypothetical protein VGF23_11995 [Gaiellaceae bacterium]